MNLDQLDNVTAGPTGQTNRQLIQQNLKIVLCPADKDAATPRTRSDNASSIPLALTSYAGNVGDHVNGTGSTGFPTTASYPYGNGADLATKARGVITRYGYGASFGDITDGLSNTFIVGEVVPGWCVWQDWGHQSFATTAWPINYQNAALANGTIAATDANTTIVFRSKHSGGANFLLGDGSVRFVNESVDYTAYRAAASRCGGESLSLD